MSALSTITCITLPPSPEEGVGHYPKLFRWGFAARRTKLPILMRETTSFPHRKLITQCLCKPDRVKMYPFSDQSRCWKNLTLCGCTYLYCPHKAGGLPHWLECGRCARKPRSLVWASTWLGSQNRYLLKRVQRERKPLGTVQGSKTQDPRKINFVIILLQP